MVEWHKLLEELCYTPEGGGAIVDKYDAEKIALIAYIEGMEAYNKIMNEWSASDEIDPGSLNGRVKAHLDTLKATFNIQDNGGKFSINSSI
jgi:hypothetical protein